MNTKKKVAKRIPISDAKKLAEKLGYNRVIILAHDDEAGMTSVCTWGKSLDDCALAAEDGNRLKKIMGWPDEMCKDKPARIKRKERSGK